MRSSHDADSKSWFDTAATVKIDDAWGKYPIIFVKFDKGCPAQCSEYQEATG